jgi:hypothetical protein
VQRPYWNLPVPPAQICNFRMRIDEHIVIRDEADQETRLRGTISCRGRQAAFDLSTSEFASNSRLKNGDLQFGARTSSELVLKRN